MTERGIGHGGRLVATNTLRPGPASSPTHRQSWLLERAFACGQDTETRRRVLSIQLLQVQEAERRPGRLLGHVLLGVLVLFVLAICGGALR